MRTRSALFIAATLSLAVLLPVLALAGTADEEKDDGKVKTKTIKVVTVGGSNGFLGVGVADVDDDRAKELGLHEDYGVEVNSVVKNSAAEKAGVKKGDVVLEYNGTKVENTAQFIRMIRETRPGRQVKLQVFRDGHTTTLSGQMEKRPQPQVYWKSKGDEGDFYYSTPESPEPPEPPDMDLDDDDFQIEIPDIDIHIPEIAGPNMFWRAPRLGVETEGLGKQLAEYFGVKDGVLVRSVIKGSAAEKAGLKAGDVIVKIGGQDVTRPGDISSVLRSTEATDLPIVVMRNRKEVTVTAKIEARSHTTTTLPKKRTSLFMVPKPPPTPTPDMEWDEEEADDL